MAQRQQLIELLSRLVSDGKITEPEAHNLLARYDAKEFGDLDLPLPPAEFVPMADEHNDKDILLALVGIIDLHPSDLSIKGRTLFVDEIQDVFIYMMESNAKRLVHGVLPKKQKIRYWQIDTLYQYKLHIIQQAMLGRGVDSLDDATTAQINDRMRTDAAYMSRFADEIALGVLTGALLSEAYIANRSAAYGGTGRGEFYRGIDEAISSELGSGWVDEYVAVDDRHTCEPCQQAQGFYLPSTGPYPGVICYGGGRCRCSRRPVYDPGMYARLGGR